MVAAARASGYFVSIVSESYAACGRDLCIGTLDDWGWHGLGEPPTWYSGRAWGGA